MNRQQMKEAGKQRLLKTQPIEPGKRTGGQVLNVLLAEEGEEKQIPKPSTVVKSTVVENTTDNVRIQITSNYHRTDNDISDLLAQLQTTTEQSIYRRLYRLSYGFRKNTCRVGMGKLAKHCNISSCNKTVKKAIDGLIQKGHISVVEEHGNSKLGTLYRVYLPCEISGIKSVTVVKTTVVETNKPTVVETTVVENSAVAQTQANQASTPTVVETTVVENTTIILKKYNNLSLSHIIDLFYTGIGQTKISQKKRESAESCIKKLREEGYSLEQIAYTVEYTLKKGKAESKKYYDFKIIEHTIGEAMECLTREEAKAQKEYELRAEQEAKETSRLECEKVKEAMKKSDRQELREQARRELIDAGHKPAFIVEPVISAQENDILRRNRNNGKYA